MIARVEPAHAKINLGLRVGPLETNGYHAIRTLISPIELHDEVTVCLVEGTSGDDASRRISIDATLDERLRNHLEAQQEGAADRLIGQLQSPVNLMWRAAEGMLERYFPKSTKVRLSLLKRIPTEAGLGGGSADAAAVIRALASLSMEQLGGCGATEDELRAFARSLGSDVPALLRLGAVGLVGQGEVLCPLNPTEREEFRRVFQDLVLLVCKPPFGSATGRMYRELDELRVSEQSSVELPPTLKSDPGVDFSQDPRARDGNHLSFLDKALTLSASEGNPVALSEVLKQTLVNDFERVYFKMHPEMEALKGQLEACGAGAVFLAGSGSTLIALFQSAAYRSFAIEEKAVQLHSRLSSSGFFTEWTRACP